MKIKKYLFVLILTLMVSNLNAIPFSQEGIVGAMTEGPCPKPIVNSVIRCP